MKRQQFDVDAYYNDWVAANAAAGNGEAPPWTGPTVGVEVRDPKYLFGPEILPDATEQAWKDTVRMNPGEVTWIRVRFASQSGSPFVFDPTVGYYVWHCHIIDHEDNEMMRKVLGDLITPTPYLAPGSVDPGISRRPHAGSPRRPRHGATMPPSATAGR